MSVRLSARSRLALLYTALVLAAGALMTALTYVLVRQNLTTRWVLHRVLPAPGTTAPGPEPPRLQAPDIAEQVRGAALAELLSQAAVALAVVTLLAAALGWVVAGRILAPIRAISATAQRLSAEDLSERVPVTSPADELAALAVTVNGMLDRIQRGIAERDRVLESQRLFTANAAHELRTPLTTVRTAIDVTLDGDPNTAELLTMAADVRDAVENGQRTLDGLLVLARSQAGARAPSIMDLADTTIGVLDGLAAEASRRGVAVHTDLRPAPVVGERVLLESMVSNLLDNAIRYNRAEGHVVLATGASATHAFLRISNSGPYIGAGEAERLLQPFVRGASTRVHGAYADGGAGLGLSIVRAVVSTHGGELSATARPGGGLDVIVRIAAAPRAARLALQTGPADQAS
ncbi:HAMP domain-containing sensor histidine kinase [Pseudonocardia zijingensis]|uniref:histidine kinase n=1 Tax=Pseudonocardia zijingensis TaxID=153376 RepID=A0ABP3YLX4_9PSEU